MMARCNHTTKPNCAGTNSTDIVTYRYDGHMVYVPVAPSYDQALLHARDAFPQLKDLRDACLSLSLSAPAQGHAQKHIGISAPAWPKLIGHMSRYQIIDVHVNVQRQQAAATAPRIPDITITYADAEDAQATTESEEPAPPYQRSVTDDRGSRDVEDEKAVYSAHKAVTTRPRSPSASTLHPKRSWFFQKLTGQ